MKSLVLFILCATGVLAAACIEPIDSQTFSSDVVFCSSTFDVPSGLTITGRDFTVDCGTAVLRGNAGKSEIGLRVENADNVTIKNCNILTFDQGMYVKNVTSSLIVHNAFLKNRIGLRLLYSYENLIRDNSDKSNELAVSAIGSKYNIVMLENRNVERDFCEVNACNKFKDMNVCESGDFYCSKRCTPDLDADCNAQGISPVSVNEGSLPIETRVQESLPVVQNAPVAPVANETVMAASVKRSLGLGTQVLIYVLLYVFAFGGFQVLKRK